MEISLLRVKHIRGDTASDIYLLKIKPNGDTLWTKTYSGTNYNSAKAIIPTSDGNFIVAGYTGWYFGGAGNPYDYKDIRLFSVIDDRYAYKDVLFNFKIPVSTIRSITVICL